METRQLRRAAERQGVKDARKHQNAPVAVPSSRIETNRENAQRSTGPRTIEGKAASSQNSFKHGLYSKALIYPGENPAELDALKADLRAEHQPVNTLEEILVNEMAEQFWRIRRWREREVRIMDSEDVAEISVALLEIIPVIQRLMSAAERGFYKASTALRQFQKDRGFVPHFSKEADTTSQTAPASSNSGFVPQNTPQEPVPPRKYFAAVDARLAEVANHGDISAADIENRA